MSAPYGEYGNPDYANTDYTNTDYASTEYANAEYATSEYAGSDVPNEPGSFIAYAVEAAGELVWDGTKWVANEVAEAAGEVWDWPPKVGGPPPPGGEGGAPSTSGEDGAGPTP